MAKVYRVCVWMRLKLSLMVVFEGELQLIGSVSTGLVDFAGGLLNITKVRKLPCLRTVMEVGWCLGSQISSGYQTRLRFSHNTTLESGTTFLAQFGTNFQGLQRRQYEHALTIAPGALLQLVGELARGLSLRTAVVFRSFLDSAHDFGVISSNMQEG